MKNFTVEHVRGYLQAIDWQRYGEPMSWSLHDVADQYGEPGYRDDESMVLLGSWWIRNKGEVDHGTYKSDLKHFDGVYPRISSRLEKLKVQMEWHDEWEVDHDGYSKAYRTTGDCYQWMPSTAYDSEMLTPDDDIETWIDYARNNDQRRLNHRQVPDIVAKLTEAGWTRRPPDYEYENGWHPGQTDEPPAIAAELRRDHGDIDIVFELTETSQFYIKFVAWWKPCEED